MPSWPFPLSSNGGNAEGSHVRQGIASYDAEREMPSWPFPFLSVQAQRREPWDRRGESRSGFGFRSLGSRAASGTMASRVPGLTALGLDRTQRNRHGDPSKPNGVSRGTGGAKAAACLAFGPLGAERRLERWHRGSQASRPWAWTRHKKTGVVIRPSPTA